MTSDLTHCVVCFAGLKGIVVDCSCAYKALRRACPAVLVSASVMAVWAGIALHGNAFTTGVPISLYNALRTNAHILLMQWHLLEHLLRAARGCCDCHCCCLIMNDLRRFMYERDQGYAGCYNDTMEVFVGRMLPIASDQQCMHDPFLARFTHRQIACPKVGPELKTIYMMSLLRREYPYQNYVNCILTILYRISILSKSKRALSRHGLGACISGSCFESAWTGNESSIHASCQPE